MMKLARRLRKRIMSETRGKRETIKRLQSLRNIGAITAEKLYAIGISSPEQVLYANPEQLVGVH